MAELGPSTSLGSPEELVVAELGKENQLAADQWWQGHRRRTRVCDQETKSNIEEQTERAWVAADTERLRQPLRQEGGLVPDGDNRSGVRIHGGPERAADIVLDKERKFRGRKHTGS